MSGNPPTGLDLLPCPFCGGGASLDRNPHVNGGLICEMVVCDNDCVATFFHETEEKATAAWNTRAHSPQALPAPGEVERYERERLAIARALGERFIARGNARVTGSSYKSYDEMPYSYTVDFLADAEAVLNVFTPTLATVAAANDEGVAKAIEALEAIAASAEVRIQDVQDMGARIWRIALEDIVTEARAAIRLLSQGRGKA